MTVFFHGSFGLSRRYMSGILDKALKDPSLDDKQLAMPFGYGKPFSSKYRSWLHKCGITEMGLPMQLTPVGEVVYRSDPKFNEITTQWLLHHELVTDPERAEAWHFFALEFLPKHKTFTKADLLEGLTEKLRPHSEMHFGPGSKLNKVILRKILEVYTDEKCLGQLRLIQENGDHYVRSSPKILGPWKNPTSLTKAYTEISQ